MQFGLSEEQTLLQDTINRFLQDNVSLEAVRAYADDGSDREIWQQLCELGISSLLIGEDHGGLGLTTMDAAIVAECLGYACAPTPFLSSAAIVPTILSLAGSQEARLGQIASGDLRIGCALSEAVGTRLNTQLSATEGHLNGTALYAFDADADAYLVVDDQCHVYLIAADTPNLERSPLTTVDRSRRTVQLDFSGCSAELITDDPEIVRKGLDIGRVMLAADTLGAAQCMLDKSVAYAKEREQFNRPIGSFQAVKHMCAEMAAELEPCRAMVWFAAHALDELPDEARLTACHTKAHLSEVGKFVAKTATEVHGGMGFTDLLGLHYWFKRCGSNRQWLGSPEHVREEAAQLQGLVSA